MASVGSITRDVTKKERFRASGRLGSKAREGSCKVYIREKIVNLVGKRGYEP